MNKKTVAYTLLTSISVQTIQPFLLTLMTIMALWFASPASEASAATTPVTTTIPLTFKSYQTESMNNGAFNKYICKDHEYTIPNINGTVDINSISLTDTNAMIIKTTPNPNGTITVTIRGNTGTPINLGVSASSNVIFGFKDVGGAVSNIIGSTSTIPDSEDAKEKSSHYVDMITWWLETLTDDVTAPYPRGWVTAMYFNENNGADASLPTTRFTTPDYTFTDGTKIPTNTNPDSTYSGGKLFLSRDELKYTTVMSGVKNHIASQKAIVYSSSNDFSSMMNTTGKLWTNGDGVNGNYPTETYSESCINTETIGISSKITFPIEVEQNSHYAEYTRTSNFPSGTSVSNYPL